MAGYIGSKASVVSSGAENKKVFDITTTTTSLTGLVYTPTLVHVFHNGVRLVDGTDYTATSGTTITLTVAAENGDQVVVISYATFQTSDTVSASAGGTFAGDVTMTGKLNVDQISDADNTGPVTVTDGLNVSSGNVLVGTTSNYAENVQAAFYGASNGGISLASGTSGLSRLMFADGVAGTAGAYVGSIIYSHADDSMRFNANGGTERMRILSTGGITFNGDTAAANALNDYEQGDWTPSSSDAGGAYYSNGKYVKVGGSVFIQANIGNIGGGIDFGSLPFVPNVSSSMALGQIYQVDYPAAAMQLYSYVTTASKIKFTFSRDTGTDLPATSTDLAHSSCSISISGFYTTDA
jgi:hypothetical protein